MAPLLGTPGRFVPVVLLSAGIVFALQTTMLVWPSDMAAILNEVGSGICGVLLSRVMGRDASRRTASSVRSWCIFYSRFAFLFVLIERLSSGAFVMGQEKLDRLALLLSLDDNTQLIGLERYHAGAPLRPIVGDAGGTAR